jgi:YD repeat-containing protein
MRLLMRSLRLKDGRLGTVVGEKHATIPVGTGFGRKISDRPAEHLGTTGPSARRTSSRSPNCSASKQASGTRLRLGLRHVIAAAALVLGLQLPRAALAGVMTLPSNIAIGQAGEATASIPIEVPPGTAGMAPHLALAYSSGSGNGYVGVGWALSGLSMIERCPLTYATNNVAQPVTLTSGDVFCLDGQHLVQTHVYDSNLAYGANNATYATEIERFGQIVSHSGANGPTSFTVYDRSGLIYQYGGTADSQIACTNTDVCATSALITGWALNKVTDAVGNTMTITYHSWNGAAIPWKIDYTSNGSVVATNHVQFNYTTTRSDSFVVYSAGQPVRINELLQSIDTSVTVSGTQTVSVYTLSYGSGATGSSRLTSVVRTGTDNSTLPAITMAYCDGCGAQPDFLSAFYNELAGWTDFTYALTTSASVYVPAPFSGTGAAVYPQQNLDAARYVVSSVAEPNGIGGQHWHSYIYDYGLVDLQGRGFLGFNESCSYDATVTMTNSCMFHSQTFPLIGATTYSDTIDMAPPGGGHIFLTQEAITYSSKTAFDNRPFDYMSATSEQQLDNLSNPLPTKTMTVGSVDSYGNPLSVTSKVTRLYGTYNDVYSKTVTDTYQNDSSAWSPTNGKNWIIGREISNLASASYTDNNTPIYSSGTTTRQNTTQVSGTTGLPTATTIQPSSGVGFTLQDAFQYDAFGNRVQQVATGDSQSRTASLVYGSATDPASELPATVTNALNQSASLQYDMRFGEPIVSTDINHQTTSYTYDGFGRSTSVKASDGSTMAVSYLWCSGINGGTLTCPQYGAYAVSVTHKGQDNTTEIEPTLTTYYDGLDRVLVTSTQGFDGSNIWILRALSLYPGRWGRGSQRLGPTRVCGGRADQCLHQL